MTTVAIDFDDTIAPWGPLFDLDPPFRGVADAMTALRDAGYRIVILTSRLSPAWWEEAHFKFDSPTPEVFGSRNARYIEDYLRYWQIPFDSITSEKIKAEVYFDDRAVQVDPGLLANEIAVWLEDNTWT